MRWKFNLPEAPPLWRGMGKVGQKLHESNVCSFGEQISHIGRCFNYDMCCEANNECKTVESSKFRCYWPRSTDSQSFYAWQLEWLLTTPTKRRGIY